MLAGRGVHLRCGCREEGAGCLGHTGRAGSLSNQPDSVKGHVRMLLPLWAHSAVFGPWRGVRGVQLQVRVAGPEMQVVCESIQLLHRGHEWQDMQCSSVLNREVPLLTWKWQGRAVPCLLPLLGATSGCALCRGDFCSHGC